MDSTATSGRYVRFGSDDSESGGQTGERTSVVAGRRNKADGYRRKAGGSEQDSGPETDIALAPQSTFYEDTGNLDSATIVSENEAGPSAAVVSSADLSERLASMKRDVGTGSSAEEPSPSATWFSWRGWVGSVTGFLGKSRRHSIDTAATTRSKGLESTRAKPTDRERERSGSAFGPGWQPERSHSYLRDPSLSAGVANADIAEQRGRKGVLELGRSFVQKFTYPLRRPTTDSSRRNLLLEFGTAETDQAGFQVITRTKERTPGRSQSPQQRVEFLIKNLDTGEERYLTENEVAQMTSAEIVHQLVRRHRTVAQPRDTSQDDGPSSRSGTMGRRPSTSISGTPLARFRSMPLLSRSKNLHAQNAAAGPSSSSTRSATAPVSAAGAGVTGHGTMDQGRQAASEEVSPTHLMPSAASWGGTTAAGSSAAPAQTGSAATADGFRTPAGSLDEGVLVAMPATDSGVALDTGNANATDRRREGSAGTTEGARYRLQLPSKGTALSKREHQRLLRDFRVAQHFVRVQAPHKARGAQIIPNMCLVQCFRPHRGPVWSMEFSADGQYLATGGQDAVIMVWRVQNQPQTMNYSNSDLAQVASWLRAATTAGSSALQGFLVPSRVSADTNVAIPDDGPHRLYARQLLQVEEPHRVFQGHGGDVLCVAWSANNFLLTSSMDKTVRLWHVDYGQVLRKFLHADFVTCVAFHPRNENFFLSGSLDERIRLWNISSRHVSDYAEVRGLVTACGFTPNGEQALVGTYRGECKVYNVVRFEEGERALQYITTLEVHSRRGRNRKGSKITSFAMMPAAERVPSNRTEPTTSRSPVSSGDQTTSTLSNRQQADAKSTAQQFEVLISTNDSRIRLYRVQDLRIVSKYVGHSCTWNHIRAGFSDDFCYVITASEDRLVYIWDTVLYEHTERSAGDHSWPRHRSLFGRLFGSTGVSNAAASTPSAATTGSATVSVPDLNWRTSQTSDRSPSAPAGTAFDTRMSPSAEVQQPNLATSRSQANPYAAASSISAVPSIRRYRNERFEAFMPFTQAHVTAAIFAPQRSTQRFPVTGSSTQSMLQQPQPPAPLGSAATAPLRPPGARERFRPVARAPGFGRVVVVAAHDGTIGIFESIPADLVPW